jgi:hypothetical protein
MRKDIVHLRTSQEAMQQAHGSELGGVGGATADDVIAAVLDNGVHHGKLHWCVLWPCCKQCLQHHDLKAGRWHRSTEQQLQPDSSTLTTSRGAISARRDPLLSPRADAAAARTCKPAQVV